MLGPLFCILLPLTQGTPMARHLSILRPLPTLAAALAGLLATGSLADELSWRGAA